MKPASTTGAVSKMMRDRLLVQIEHAFAEKRGLKEAGLLPDGIWTTAFFSDNRPPPPEED